MKRVVLALLLGSVFTTACGQRLVELVPDDDNTPTQLAPVLTGIQPQRGPTAGGTSVVLTGTNLSNASEVAFGTAAAASFTVNSPTQITAVSPAGTNSVNVTVVTPGGRSNGLPFAYGNAPVITGITPSFGLSGGGTNVTIVGSGFTDTDSVTFGGTAVSAYTVVSDSQITTIAPAHAAGAVSVVVTTPVGESNEFAFTYGEAPVVTAIAPPSGSTLGGTVVTLTGTNLTGATVVNFDTTPGTFLTVVDAEHLTVTTPAHGAGPVNVTVTTAFGTSAAITFTYGLAPTLTSLTPATSPVGGGGNIVLVGTNFTSDSTVFFGTVEAVATVDSDTQITAVAPAGTSSVNVTVVTPFGTSNGQPFGYGNSPVQSSIAPNVGLIAGGEDVVITGSNFTGATAVTFGGIAGTGLTVDSATQITVTTPAQTAAGTVQVVITTPEGDSNPLPFTYGEAPTLTAAVPDFGLTTGGTTVVLTGTNFVTGSTVNFGLAPGTGVVVNSATQITVVSPAGPAGTVGISVNTPFGNAGGVSFTYGEAPVISSITPNSGDLTGTTGVVITGTALSDATVRFNGADITPTANTATSVTFDVPAGTGTVNAAVVTRFGTSGNLPFTYGNAPTIASLTPAAGLPAGTNNVVINGANFTGATQVNFGSSIILAANFVNASATAIEVIAPAGTADTDAGVTVTTPVGVSNAVQYRYAELPTATSINPTSGPSAGGTSVTVTGTGFVTGGTTVIIGGTPVSASAVTVTSPTSLTFATPANPAGAVGVEVQTAIGTSTPPVTFTYGDAPTVVAVNPNSGSTSGGTAITITGTNLTGTTAVTVGGVAATSVTVVNPTTVTAVTPAYVSGALVRDVAVTTPFGSATATGAFTYVSGAPTITSIAPTTGSTAGGTVVTITGTNFAPGSTSVTIGGVAATGVTVNSATSVTATTAAHAAGAVDVVVDNGTGSATLTNGFTYAAGTTTITQVSPDAGSTLGGTTVTLTGTGFTGATAVTFNGVAGTGVVVVSATQLTVVTPPNSAAVIDVAVTSPSGSATANGSYEFIVRTPGTITGNTNSPGDLLGTGLDWLGTDRFNYLTFACTGTSVGSCDINSFRQTPAGPITATSYRDGGGDWVGFVGAICPESFTVWNANDCTNQWAGLPD